MKKMIVAIAFGWFLLSWFANSVGLKAEEITTNNILNQTFTTQNNWSGDNLSSNHGTGIVAGLNDGYVENTTGYSLANDVGLTENEIKHGFTSNQSAEVWFWNNRTQNVIMKQIITSSNGDVVTQSKIIEGSCAVTNGCGFEATGNNTYVSGTNTNTDYLFKTRFEFNSTGNNHTAADLKLPVLTVTYNNNVVESTVVAEIQEDLKPENFVVKPIIQWQEVIIKEEPLPKMAVLANDPVVEEIITTKKQVIETIIEEVENERTEKMVSSESEPIEEFPEDTYTKPSGEIRQEFTETPKKITKEKVKKEPKEKLITKKEKNVQKEKTIKQETKQKTLQTKKEIKTKTVSLTAKLASIDVNVKDVSRNLELKNLVKLDAMLKKEMSLETYTNVNFYKPINIYGKQDLMEDNRLLYANITLDAYTSNDPVNKHLKNMSRIKTEKQKLMLQLKDLKNG
jgi:hypothetical protein